MIGNIYITGEIGVEVHLIDVIKQVQDQKEALEYNVFINSIGGYVDVGFDIYNYLEKLNKTITTIGSGYVCSIATVIFLAGTKRILKNGVQFMIHNPSGGVEGTAEQIANYNKELINVENNLIKFYSEKTSLPKEALIPLLRNESFLTIDEAFSLGFSNEKLIENIKASFKINNKKNDKKMNLNVEDKNWLENLFTNFSKRFLKSKAIMLIDANGTEINFPEVDEGTNPQVGDKGEINGVSVEDGTYVMPSLNNASITFVGGVITEIIEENKLEPLKKENESLRDQLTEMTEKYENTNKKLTDFEIEFKELKNKFTAKFNFQVKKEEIIVVDERLEKLKNKFKK